MSDYESRVLPALSDQGGDAAFTAAELENSFPFDMGRRLRDPQQSSLLASILEGMKRSEQRLRARTPRAERKWVASIDALLSNIAAAHLNVIDRSRYVAVSFNRNDYNDSGLSYRAVLACRHYLASIGYIDVAPGFWRWDADGTEHFGRRTRLRATTRMREAIDQSGITRRSLTRPVTQLIQIRKRQHDVGPPPDDVERSRDLLSAINRRLAATEIAFPAAFERVFTSDRIEHEGEDSDGLDQKRSYAGDLTAMSLYRAFKYNWRTGGRIYGGWWMSLPKTMRPYLTIDGAPVVELDYQALHPSILFSRANAPMPSDPYVVGDWTSPNMRKLGKKTFNRLVNREMPDKNKRMKIRAASGDRELLVGAVPFREYLARITTHLAPIDPWFGTGEGIRLQYEDSMLALDVLEMMEAQSIPVLPIHDSFLVPVEFESQLHSAMVSAFTKYQRVPAIHRTEPKSLIDM